MGIWHLREPYGPSQVRICRKLARPHDHPQLLSVGENTGMLTLAVSIARSTLLQKGSLKTRHVKTIFRTSSLLVRDSQPIYD
jgi:hypothetical protein